MGRTRSFRCLTIAISAVLMFLLLLPQAAMSQTIISRPPTCEVVHCPPDRDCDADATTPSVSGGTVKATASASCEGAVQQLTAVAHLQIHTFGPWWQNVAEDQRTVTDASKINAFTLSRCIPDEHDYRLVVDIEWINYSGKTSKDQDVSAINRLDPSGC